MNKKMFVILIYDNRKFAGRAIYRLINVNAANGGMMKENKNVKEKVMKMLLIDGRLPRTSYVLRTFVGFYLIYIDYNIWSGIGEPDVSSVPLVMAAGVLFAVVAALCIASGAYGLMNKEYREEKMDDEQAEAEVLVEGQPEERSSEEKSDILQENIVPKEKNE